MAKEKPWEKTLRLSRRRVANGTRAYSKRPGDSIRFERGALDEDQKRYRKSFESAYKKAKYPKWRKMDKTLLEAATLLGHLACFAAYTDPNNKPVKIGNKKVYYVTKDHLKKAGGWVKDICPAALNIKKADLKIELLYIACP